MQIAIKRGEVPDVLTISKIIHSTHYKFLLAPKRKIYFASLFFISNLYRNFESLRVEIDEHEFMGRLLEICSPFE